MARKNATKSNAPVASAIATAYAVILPCLTMQASEQQATGEANKSRLSTIVTAIGALYEAHDDAGAYLTDVQTLFGNGIKGKENIAGTLGDALKAHCKSIGMKLATAYNTLSKARGVANHWADAKVRTTATEKGLAAAYELNKPSRAAADPDATGSEQANAVELTGPEWVRTHLDETLDVLVAMFARAADSIALERIKALEIHLNGKTARKAG